METLDAGGSVRTMFVDFRKAFDHVDHNLLISKLLSYDIPHCIIRWVHSYLSHRRQRVRVNGELSAWTRLIGGMPQGLWLGPLTFLVLINGLIIECRVHKFIDDTTLTETLLSRPHTSIMQTYVDQLEAWTANNHMIINTNKTKEMLLGPLSKSSPYELLIGQVKAERVAGFILSLIHI